MDPVVVLIGINIYQVPLYLVGAGSGATRAASGGGWPVKSAQPPSSKVSLCCWFWTRQA